jgi:WD40 repeat protein
MLPLPASGQCHYTVAFSPCGRWLAAGGSACALDVWDLRAPHAPPRRFQDQGGPILCTAFAPTGRLIAVSTHWLQTFDPVEPTMYTARRVFDARRAAVAPDGTAFALTAPTLRHGPIDIHDGHLEWARDDRPGTVTDAAITADGRVFAARVTAAGGGLIEQFARAGGADLDAMPVSGRPHRVACTADGARAATITNGNLCVWDVAARAAVADRAAPAHGGWLSVAFDPRGRTVLTGGIDGGVALWDANSAAPPLTAFQWGVGPVYAVAFDADGLRAAAAGHTGAIVWDVDG